VVVAIDATERSGESDRFARAALLLIGDPLGRRLGVVNANEPGLLVVSQLAGPLATARSTCANGRGGVVARGPRREQAVFVIGCPRRLVSCRRNPNESGEAASWRTDSVFRGERREPPRAAPGAALFPVRASGAVARTTSAIALTTSTGGVRARPDHGHVHREGWAPDQRNRVVPGDGLAEKRRYRSHRPHRRDRPHWRDRLHRRDRGTGSDWRQRRDRARRFNGSHRDNRRHGRDRRNRPDRRKRRIGPTGPTGSSAVGGHVAEFGSMPGVGNGHCIGNEANFNQQNNCPTAPTKDFQFTEGPVPATGGLLSALQAEAAAAVPTGKSATVNVLDETASGAQTVVSAVRLRSPPEPAPTRARLPWPQATT
jgi:hypothetical protein